MLKTHCPGSPSGAPESPWGAAALATAGSGGAAAAGTLIAPALAAAGTLAAAGSSISGGGASPTAARLLGDSRGGTT